MSEEERMALHDALVDAALMPTTGPMLARAAFRLRSALVGPDHAELVASAAGMQSAIENARAMRERVPGELARSLARIVECLHR